MNMLRYSIYSLKTEEDDFGSVVIDKTMLGYAGIPDDATNKVVFEILTGMHILTVNHQDIKIVQLRDKNDFRDNVVFVYDIKTNIPSHMLQIS